MHGGAGERDALSPSERDILPLEFGLRSIAGARAVIVAEVTDKLITAVVATGCGKKRPR